MTVKQYFLKRLKSFAFAFRGIFDLFRTEPNARIHFAVTLAVVVAGFLFNISKMEWIAILFAIAMVISAEAFNTSIEKLVNHLFPYQHESARIIKDISAGAVLICAIIAIVIGCIIFLPKLFS
jgi:diacylglycerol kinase (ATP)